MMNRIQIISIAAAMFLVSQGAHAIVSLEARELADHCEAYPEAIDTADGQYCVRYIQGFIDGAVATDARVMLNVEAERDRKETFSERAYRTRSRDRSEQRRAARYAGYCLGEPVPLREVVDHVVADLNDETKAVNFSTAREAVYASLRSNYPCKADKATN